LRLGRATTVQAGQYLADPPRCDGDGCFRVRGSIEHLNRPSSPPLDPGRRLVQHDRAHLEAGDHRQRVLLLVRAKAPSMRRHRHRLT